MFRIVRALMSMLKNEDTHGNFPKREVSKIVNTTNLNCSSPAEALHGEERGHGRRRAQRYSRLRQPVPIEDGDGALAAGVALHLAHLPQVVPHLLRRPPAAAGEWN